MRRLGFEAASSTARESLEFSMRSIFAMTFVAAGLIASAANAQQQAQPPLNQPRLNAAQQACVDQAKVAGAADPTQNKDKVAQMLRCIREAAKNGQ
jgi:hypothetical protein